MQKFANHHRSVAGASLTGCRSKGIVSAISAAPKKVQLDRNGNIWTS